MLSFLVNDLTDLFKIRTGKFVPLEEEVDLRDIVQEVFDIFSIQSGEKGLDLKLESDKFIPTQMRIDSTRFKQVLVNLIGNSLKFTFRGSIFVHLAYDFSKNELQVTVKDTGIGIKESDRQKLFDMFCRIETTLNSNTSGIGFGLSISN